MYAATSVDSARRSAVWTSAYAPTVGTATRNARYSTSPPCSAGALANAAIPSGATIGMPAMNIAASSAIGS